MKTTFTYTVNGCIKEAMIDAPLETYQEVTIWAFEFSKWLMKDNPSITRVDIKIERKEKK